MHKLSLFYCKGCGAIFTEDHECCPECGAEGESSPYRVQISVAVAQDALDLLTEFDSWNMESALSPNDQVKLARTRVALWQSLEGVRNARS